MQNPFKPNASTRLAMPFIWAKPRWEHVSCWERGAGHNPITTKDLSPPHGPSPPPGLYSHMHQGNTSAHKLSHPKAEDFFLFVIYMYPKKMKSWHTTRDDSQLNVTLQSYWIDKLIYVFQKSYLRLEGLIIKHLTSKQESNNSKAHSLTQSFRNKARRHMWFMLLQF